MTEWPRLLRGCPCWETDSQAVGQDILPLLRNRDSCRTVFRDILMQSAVSHSIYLSHVVSLDITFCVANFISRRTLQMPRIPSFLLNYRTPSNNNKQQGTHSWIINICINLPLLPVFVFYECVLCWFYYLMFILMAHLKWIIKYHSLVQRNPW